MAEIGMKKRLYKNVEKPIESFCNKCFGHSIYSNKPHLHVMLNCVPFFQ